MVVRGIAAVETQVQDLCVKVSKGLVSYGDLIDELFVLDRQSPILLGPFGPVHDSGGTRFAFKTLQYSIVATIQMPIGGWVSSTPDPQQKIVRIEIERRFHNGIPIRFQASEDGLAGIDHGGDS